jgi:ABC-type transport system involved in multi-copper enzyme maturation permease subunit
MSLLKSLVTENPMLIEITRFRRKFFGAGSSAANSVLVALSGLIFLGLMAVVWSNRESANPIILVMLQTGIFTLLAPAMLHGSIAGEREKRSWDFLLVAPVTQAQIIFGKFMSAAMAILACAALFMLPIGIGVIFYKPYSYGYGNVADESGWSFWNLIEAELLSVSWGLVLCAMSIFFSARARRGFIALGTTLAILVASLIVWPILTVSAGLTGDSGGFLNFFHPFWALTQIESANHNRAGFTSGAYYGFPQILIYLAMTAVFMAWAERTLKFADNEVKFIPKHKDA